MSANEKTEKGNEKQNERKIRYAVVGLGHIAQVAVLPAFAHAKETSELAALVSDDKEKLATMSKEYDVKNVCPYEDYDKLLSSGNIDAVYIALVEKKESKTSKPDASLIERKPAVSKPKTVNVESGSQ